jgi:hypothetical protein
MESPAAVIDVRCDERRPDRSAPPLAFVVRA